MLSHPRSVYITLASIHGLQVHAGKGKPPRDVDAGITAAVQCTVQLQHGFLGMLSAQSPVITAHSQLASYHTNEYGEARTYHEHTMFELSVPPYAAVCPKITVQVSIAIEIAVCCAMLGTALHFRGTNELKN
jgi:hypothetical protein